jgi:hypothetical protein
MGRDGREKWSGMGTNSGTRYPGSSLPGKVQVKFVLQYPLREVPIGSSGYFMVWPKRRRPRK